jgi:hypothetical protein
MLYFKGTIFWKISATSRLTDRPFGFDKADSERIAGFIVTIGFATEPSYTQSDVLWSDVL